MTSVDTVRITDPDYPGGILINATDYNEKVHTLHKGGKAGTKGSRPTQAREERGADLDALPAADVKVIAEGLGLEHTNKAESIQAILAKEFSEE